MWYIPTRYTLEMLVQSSPVPVSFVSKFKSEKSIGRNDVCLATFYSGPVAPHIEILSSSDYNTKILSLIHELSHARCHKKRCRCWNMDKLGEIHAYAYTLKWLIKNKRKELLKIQMRTLSKMQERTDYYSDAVRYIMTTRLWQRCLGIMKEK